MVDVRLMRPGDAARVLELMRGLAEFEGYIDDFAVTEADLIEAAADLEAPFRCHVAFLNGEAVGIAVTHTAEWTFDRLPTLVLKELYVDPACRGTGAGQALFAAVQDEAEKLGASRIRWLVLTGNEAAKAFYKRMGASHLKEWEQWELATGAPVHS